MKKEKPSIFDFDSIKTIKAVLISWIIVFLIFAFVMWQINPMEWPSVARFICALFFIGVYIAIVFPDEGNNMD